MKYTSLIDNVKSLEWGLNIQEAYLFSWVYSLPSWADKVIICTDVFYFGSKTKAIEDYPLLTDKPDTVYRYYKSLEQKGLILIKKIDGKDYLALTEKSKTWGSKSDHSEKNPTTLGKKSELNSEKNPTYNSISIISELKDTEEEKEKPTSADDNDDVPFFVKEQREKITPPRGAGEISRESLKADFSENDYCRMQAGREGIQTNDYENLVNEFILEKFGLEENTKWKDIKDARSHFVRWIPYFKSKTQKQNEGSAKNTGYSNSLRNIDNKNPRAAF